MSQKTSIEWTDATWNTVTGCTKISLGCKYCYAEKFSHRLQIMGVKKYVNCFNVTLHPESLIEPFGWHKPRLVFVNSMSDLVHEQVPEDFIIEIFNVMAQTPIHTYQILTKRAERMVEIMNRIVLSENIWIGVTVEHNKYRRRIDLLREVSSVVKFLSLEPLLGPMGYLNLNGINWVVVGGESGYNARECKIEWVREIREQCLRANVPFFFKQWGGKNKKVSGRVIDGRTWDEMPIIST